jgi:RNA polymerase sigma factor (sigma-70 family)
MLTNELILTNLNLAESIARKKRIFGTYQDELISAAYFGLVKAANNYQESKGNFKIYASFIINLAIKDYLRELKWGNRRNVFKKHEYVDVHESKNSMNIDELLERLDEQGKKIIKAYYFEFWTMQEIAQKINLCESRVSQLINDYKKILKKELVFN